MDSRTLESRECVAIDCDQLQAELVEKFVCLVSEEPTDGLHFELVDLANQLFSLLPVQFDLKRSEGYLHDVTDKFPNWNEQVELLKIEQALLYEDLREIRDQLEAGVDSETTVVTIAPMIQDWVSRLRRHDKEERKLSQVAMNLDVGGQSG